MIGRTIGHYHLEQLLGRGGMGEVYRALDTKLNRPVAIKLLTGRDADLQPQVERFVREARAASSLNHPHIVTIHDAGRTDDGQYYITQEFVDGETLRALLHERLPIDRTVTLAAQLARALSAAHAAGIVHRDLKPENLMVRRDGYLKILDFGLARVVPSSDSSAETLTGEGTSPGTVLGTTFYMSPEQATARPIGPPSDIFSFGIVLYEMLAGVRPFTGDGPLAVLNAILTEHPTAPSRINPDVAPAIDSLVLGMLAKEPAERPTVDVVVRELESAARPGLAAVRPLPSPERLIVGRQRERDELELMFGRVTRGAGRMVAVTGEPGIGKTTLVEEFLDELVRGAHQPSVARGRCSERLAGTEAFLPIFEVLDQLQHGQAGGAFSDIMRRLAPTWYVRVATLAAASASTERMLTESQSASPERMKRELATFFQEMTRVRPLVLFFEDLHWADMATIDVLNYLADRFDQLRVLVVVTYRPSEMLAANNGFLRVQQNLKARDTCEELALEFLSIGDVERYVRLLFPGHDLPPEFVTLVHQKTEGNPFFMTDLLQYLRDLEVIVLRHGRWTLARDVLDVAKELPESVKSTITRAIDRLDQRDRRLMAVASVQGYEFDARVVSEVLDLDVADTEDRLADLATNRRLITLVETREFPDRELTVRYRFVHVLYQNALFAALQPTRRAGFSLKVARSLEAHYRDEATSIAAELAVLFETGRDFARAAQSFLAAAARALSLFAYREVALLASRGLETVKALPAGPERLQLELGLQLYLGLSLRTLEGWAAPQVEKIYLRAREIYHELGDPPELFSALWGLTLFHAIRGDVAKFTQLAEQLLEQATESGRNEFLIGAHQMMGSSREFLGETEEANRHFEEAIRRHDLRDLKKMTELFGLDPGMIARSLGPRPLWFLGFPDQAAARAADAVRYNREARQLNSLVFAMVIAQHIHLLRGEPEQTIALGEELIPLCREYGLAQELEWGRCYQGAGLVELGRIDEGVALLRDSLDAMERISSGLLRPMFLAMLIEGLRVSDRVDEGLARVDEAIAWGDRSLERFYHAELWRLQGELRRMNGDIPGAEESFSRASDHGARQRALGFELRSAMASYRLNAAMGRDEQSRGALGAVYARFTEGFETGDLTEARRLMASG